eukprot:GILI01016240.1.p1 GENE.GILI01016240.1~~GILI01016240.1.p1  ORF type:complete len:197 (-),score=31.00 GILI01016240.1:346-936(-)
MHEIIPNLFIGSDTDAKNEETLKDHEVRVIVNCSPQDSSCYFPDQFEYEVLDWEDTDRQDIAKDLERVADVIDKKLEDNIPVMVHCFMGISRSSSVIIGYLFLKRSMTLYDAFKATKEKKTVIRPNLSFMRQLCEVEKARDGRCTVDLRKYTDWFWSDDYSNVTVEDMDLYLPCPSSASSRRGSTTSSNFVWQIVY